MTRDEFDSALQEVLNSCTHNSSPCHAILFNVETGDFERFQSFPKSDPAGRGTGIRATKAGKPEAVCEHCLTRYFGNPQFMKSPIKQFPKLQKTVYLPINGLTFELLQIVQVHGA